MGKEGGGDIIFFFFLCSKDLVVVWGLDSVITAVTMPMIIRDGKGDSAVYHVTNDIFQFDLLILSLLLLKLAVIYRGRVFFLM